MDFLNHREGCVHFYHVSSFLLYRNYKRLCEFKETEISRQAVAVIVNSKGEENS
jgi:hypothetical protein